MKIIRTAYLFLGLFSAIISLPVLGQTSNAVGGAVEVSDECYTVTIPAEWQNGAVWFLDPINLSEPFEIDLKLTFGFNDDLGADGMVFVMQTVGTDLLGEPGGGLGFGGISPSLGVEFDTFQNTDISDPFADHIALVRNGDVNHNSTNTLSGPISAASDGSNIEDGEEHLFRVNWNPDEQLLQLYFDCELRIEYEIDIVEDIFNGTEEVFWGFTGSTGGLFNAQSVCLDAFTLGLPEDASICQGEEIVLGVNGPEDGTYEWSPVEGVSDPGISNPTFSPDETTTYTVVYTDLCGETQTDDVTVEVTNLDLDLGPNLFACPGDEVTIAAPEESGATYVWNGAAGGSTYTTDEPGTIELEYTLNSCTATDELEFLNYDLLFPIDPPIDPFTEICEGEEVTYTVSCDGCVWEWNGNGVFDPLSGGYIVNEDGIVGLNVSDENGCSQSFEAEVSVLDLIDPELPALIEACDGQSVSITAAPGGTYEWSTGETSATINTTEGGVYTVVLSNGECSTEGSTEVVFLETPEWTLPTFYNLCPGDSLEFQGPYGSVTADFGEGDAALTIYNEGSYPVLLSLGETGCESSVTIQVNGLDEPVVELPESFVLCEGTVGTLYADIFPEGSDIQWEDGTTSSLYTVTEAGEYLVSLSNSCGVDSAKTQVTVEPCSCDLWVPNAFTPDGDGVNEVFQPVIECLPDTYEFLVFNRWGEVIFRSEELGEGWLGEVNGGSHFAINDVYAWMVTYSHSVTGEAIIVTRRGTVAIIR